MAEGICLAAAVEQIIIVPPTPSPVRMNGHKAKAPSPAESLCSVQCEATEPLQAGARKRIRDAPDCGLQPVGSINVEGVVSLDLLISEFRKTMNEVLDDRMAAIIVEVEELKNTCKELKERVEVLGDRNRKLTCIVESLGRSDASRTHPSPVAGPQLDHTVREIVLEERRQHELKDNVIISGLPDRGVRWGKSHPACERAGARSEPNCHYRETNREALGEQTPAGSRSNSN